MITVRDIGPEESELWNRFVGDQPGAGVSHLYQWKTAVEKAYHLETRYLGAFESGRVVGILPTTVIKRPLGSRIAVSVAFAHFAGWLIDKDTDEQQIGRLFVEYLDKQGIRTIELRQLAGPDAVPAGGVTLVKTLGTSPDAMWTQLDAKVRNQVRKATKSGLSVRWGKDQLDDFYMIYAKNTRYLGSPVHSSVFFKELLEHLPSFSDVLSIRLEEKPIAAMLLLGFHGQLSDPWAASLREYDKLCPNMLMYWEAFRFGCQNAYATFDMGRSQVGSNTYRFKSQWGAEAVPLAYTSLTIDGSLDHSSTDAYRSSKAKLVSSIWKTLPLPLTLWLGPRIRKYLP